MKVRIEVIATQIGSAHSFEYQSSMVGARNVRRSYDDSFCICEVDSLPEGARLATEQDELDLLSLGEREDAAKAECTGRIFAVADQIAQMNLTARSGAGLLSTEERGTWQLALGWVDDMRSIWPSLAENKDDIKNDANWPAVPPGVLELCALY